ncbi:MAG: helix-turn-helix domain-containing protein [Thermoleophilaceae bacterium]|nr:helix-turn-helix domain-containing protein [Thermoleophilaceae bacterium]
MPSGTAAALRSNLEPTVDEVIHAIRTAVPAYAGPLEGAFGEGIRTAVAHALSQFLDKVEGRQPAASGGSDLYFDLGRGEARAGRSLEALLAAYRVGARVAWRATVSAAREAGFGAETLSVLAEAIFAYIDELSARSAEGFAFEQSIVAGQAASRRRALVYLLAQFPPAERAAVETAARDAGWSVPSRLAAVVWQEDPDGRVATRLPLGSVTATFEGDTHCAFVPDADAPGRRAEVARAIGHRRAAIGPVVPSQEAWRSAERAIATIRLAQAGMVPDGRPLEAEQQLPQLIVHRDEQLLDELARRALAPLDDRTAKARARLLETLRGWLDHQGHVPDVARALHVHPQTVRYRLAQLRDAFGAALDDPPSRFELSLAVRARQRRRA